MIVVTCVDTRLGVSFLGGGAVRHSTDERSNTAHPSSGFEDLNWSDFVLAVGRVTRHKLHAVTLGTRPDVLIWYTANTLQGNGQRTCHLPTRYTASTFRIFPASFPAISLVQEMISTFTVFPVM